MLSTREQKIFAGEPNLQKLQIRTHVSQIVGCCCQLSYEATCWERGKFSWIIRSRQGTWSQFNSGVECRRNLNSLGSFSSSSLARISLLLDHRAQVKNKNLQQSSTVKFFAGQPKQSHKVTKTLLPGFPSDKWCKRRLRKLVHNYGLTRLLSGLSPTFREISRRASFKSQEAFTVRQPDEGESDRERERKEECLHTQSTIVVTTMATQNSYLRQGLDPISTYRAAFTNCLTKQEYV